MRLKECEYSLSLENLPGEEWRDIPKYKGRYQASNKGRIKKLKRIISTKNQYNKYKRIIEEMIILPTLNIWGYLTVGLLDNNNKRTTEFIHKMVAFAFIPNDDPQNKTQINHKDENKLNNCVENLEWCTPKYNTNYGTGPQRRKEKLSIPIVQTNMSGNIVKIWDSTSEAGKNGYSIRNIHDCIVGKRNKHNGYKWVLLEDYKSKLTEEEIEYYKNKSVPIFSNEYDRNLPIVQLDLDGNYIKTWNCTVEASKNGFDENHIRECCRGKRNKHGGFKWVYLKDYKK